MRIVLDTNVIISAVFFGGVPGEILQAWREGDIQLVVSPEILAEYQEVIQELAVRYNRDPGEFFQIVASHADIVLPPPLPDRVSEDSEDDKFLACAIAAGATCIVSGDGHLLKVTGYREVEVMTPRAFLDRHLSARKGHESSN